MHDNQSFQKCSREDGMGQSIAMEAQSIVRRSAEPVAPGETVKGQIRKACRALGYNDGDWRIRAAWYGEAASWSAEAFEELKSRFSKWERRQKRLADAEAMKAASLYSAIAKRLEGTDAEFHRSEIAALVDMARRIVGPSSDVT